MSKKAIIILSVLAVLIIFVSTLPLTLNFAVPKILAKLSDQPIYIEELKINPFTGVVKIKKMGIVGTEKSPAILLENISTNLQIAKLLKKEVFLDHVNFSKLEISINENQPNQNIIKINKLALKNFSFREGGINVGNLQVEDLALRNKDQKITSYFKSGNIKNITVSLEAENQQIDIKEIEIIRPIFAVLLDKIHDDKSAEFTKILINNFFYKLSDGNNQLKLKINQNGFIEANFSDKNELDLKIKDLSLTPFSETFSYQIGRNIKSGSVDLDLDVSVIEKDKSGEMKGKIAVLLSQFYLGEKNVNSKKDTIIPLNTALQLLRDKNRNIKIKTDFNIEDENLDVHFIPLIRQIFGKFLINKTQQIIIIQSLEKIAPMLLQTSTFSPTTIFSLVKGGAFFVNKPRFNNINFRADSSKLTKENKKSLEKIILFLKNNPEINLRFCPLVVKKEQDIELSEKRALKLAEKRIEYVKSFIVNSEEEVINNIIFCRLSLIDKELADGGVIEIDF